MQVSRSTTSHNIPKSTFTTNVNDYTTLCSFFVDEDCSMVVALSASWRVQRAN